MKVDGQLGAGQTAAVIEEARRHEKAGYDGLAPRRLRAGRRRCSSPPWARS
jgi:hypothetical protein